MGARELSPGALKGAALRAQPRSLSEAVTDDANYSWRRSRKSVMTEVVDGVASAVCRPRAAFGECDCG